MIEGIIEQLFEDVVPAAFEPSDEQRQHTADKIVAWFESLQFKPQPDLDKLKQEVIHNIFNMVDGINVKFVDNAFELDISNKAYDTFRMLERGTLWFPGHSDLTNYVTGLLTSDPE